MVSKINLNILGGNKLKTSAYPNIKIYGKHRQNPKAFGTSM